MLIPTTLITGYLGAGKTTLLRNIVKGSPVKIAILMNEFGDISIDGKIVKGKNITMTELSGGCVCCSLSGEFEAAIGEIIEKINPQWIIVETTGVAEPTALANDILENIAGVVLDSIITLVDAESIIKFPSIGHTGIEQIQVADILILNKIDLLKKDQINEVKTKISSINKKAVIIETINADVDIKLIFGMNAKHRIRKSNSHKNQFEQFDYVSIKKINKEKFLKWINSIPNAIYRCKGFINSDKGGIFVNNVSGRSTFEDFEVEKNELVFIGQNILKYKDSVLEQLKKIEIQ